MKGELKQILLRHEGRDQAITGKQLAELLGYKDDRVIRETIAELIDEGLPVAASCSGTMGYFVVNSRIEANDYAQSLKSRLIADAVRRRNFRRASDQWLTPAVQGRMV
jgi:hypothetical protein